MAATEPSTLNSNVLTDPGDLSLLNMTGVPLDKLFAVTINDVTQFWIYETGSPSGTDKAVNGYAARRFRQTY